MNKVSSQTLGRQFEVLVSEFLRDTFLNLSAIRPGKWIVRRAGSGIRTSDFAQYEHLELLSKIVSENPKLAASDIRKRSGGRPILHASISAKFTIRSDRAQNSRTEALNLIRNRKGHLPHIAAVTAEPMPGRLASLALGTGDIDCVYHFALYELAEALKEYGSDDSLEILDTLINGKRLKDISDLPLDLSV